MTVRGYLLSTAKIMDHLQTDVEGWHMGDGAEHTDGVTRVLVVNDDPSLRSMMCEILQLEGFAVETASEGRQALAFLQRATEPHIVLLDDRMPVMDGLAVMEAVVADATLASRHAFVFCGNRLGGLPPSLAMLLSRLKAPVLSYPYTVQALLRVVGEAAAQLPTEAP
jgi:CheY-like chemotaxis protein